MNISFVIPAFNEEKYIGACLEGILSCDKKLIHEVIVVNNGSTDGTDRIVRSYKERLGSCLKLIDESRKGRVFARKKGFEVASGDYIASIDADCRPNGKWLRTICDYFECHPQTVCVSGPYLFYDLHASLKVFNALKEFLFHFLLPYILPSERGQVWGGNFVARREALKKAHGFSTAFSSLGDDVNIERCLKKIGPVIFSTRFFIPSSARRINHEGAIYTFLRYRMNRYFQLLTGRLLFRVGLDKDWR